MKYTLTKVPVEKIEDFDRPRAWHEFGDKLADEVTKVYVELLLQMNPDISLSMSDYLEGRILCANVWNMPSLCLVHNSGEKRYSITDTRHRNTQMSDNESLFLAANHKLYLAVISDGKKDEFYEVWLNK